MAEEGDAFSQYTVGNAYYNGTQVPRDLDKAHEWLEKANKQWFYPAISRLGDLYYETTKSKVNKEKAVRYWLVDYNGRKLIESAYRFAKNYRAIYTDPSKNKAENCQREDLQILCWYQRAGWYGIQDGTILVKTEKYIEKLKSVLREQFATDLPLAEHGDASAQRRIAIAYQEGLIIPQDLEVAKAWWEKATREDEEKKSGGKNARQNTAANPLAFDVFQ